MNLVKRSCCLFKRCAHDPQSLDEIAASEPLIQRTLVYHVHALRRRLAFESGVVASKHGHVVVRVVEEAKQIHYRSPLQISNVYWLLQYCVAKPAA